MGFLGTGEGELYHYQPTEYKGYGGQVPTYTPYTSDISDLYGGVTKEMLSGKLTPEEQAMLTQSLGTNLATIREGAYGMPIGAQKGLESQAAQNVALQGLLMGQEKKRYGLQSALPYMQFQAGEGARAYEAGKYGYEAGLGESRYGQEWGLGEKRLMGQYEAERKKAAAESSAQLGQMVGQTVIKAGLTAATGGFGAAIPTAGAVGPGTPGSAPFGPQAPTTEPIGFYGGRQGYGFQYKPPRYGGVG